MVTITLTPTGGTNVHDVILILSPLQGGEFAAFLSAQGLQAGGTYMIEGITTGTHMSILPFTLNAAGSEFTADSQGNGVYSSVLPTDPQTVYSSVLLVYLPNGQMEGSVLIASASLG